ncbi:MAG: carboxypeptidase-like regulatory domain-containing protein, partial [Actinobacteria bacterium]|nr:carboxypeptidase-like regulatory domain-containing protein [Actinomycetota bacterium]
MPLLRAWVSAQEPLLDVVSPDVLLPTFAVTDAGGRFAMPIRAEADLHLTAFAAGHLATWSRSAPGDVERQVSLVLPRAVTATGRVVDSEGTAVQGAAVTVTPAGPFGFNNSRTWMHRTARARADGRFSLQALAPDASYVIAARAPGFAPTRIEARTSTVEQRLDLVVRLGRGSAAVGRVVDEAGTPIASAEVSLVPVPVDIDRYAMEREGEPPPEPVSTDGNGAFTVRLLPTGRYDVQAHAPGFAVGHTPGVTVEGPSTDLGEVVLVKGLELTGRVEDEEEKPIGGATVSFRTDRSSQQPGSTRPARSPRAIFDDRNAEEGPTTDEQGRFAIADLATGQTLDLQVRAEGFASRLVPGIVAPREG